MAFLWHCKAYFWIIFGTFSKVAHISSIHTTSSKGAIIPQTTMILPLKCFAQHALWKIKTIVWLPEGHTTPQNSPYPWHVLIPVAQLVLSQEAGNHGGRPPNIPWFPADPLQNPIVTQRQETHHSSKHNSDWLGSVEYGLSGTILTPLCLWQCMSRHQCLCASLPLQMYICMDDQRIFW